MDRYNHDMGCDDTDETDECPQIGSFGSYSPQYRKNTSSLVQINLPSQSFDESINSSGSGSISPTPSIVNQSLSSVNQTNLNTTIGKIMSTPQLRKLDVSEFWKMIYVYRSFFKRMCFDLGLSYKCHEIALYTGHRLYTRYVGAQ